MEITVNEQQRLFVIPAGNGGVSCLGFDVVFKQLRALINHLGLDFEARVAELGTTKQYFQYRRAIHVAGKRGGINQTWFNPDTPQTLRRLLEAYRHCGGLVRVFYGDAQTGRDWLDECDVVGRVGRSTGILKIPLLITPGEHGGPGLLDACIVRLMDATERRELWRHPDYHIPPMQIRRTATPVRYGLRYEVVVGEPGQVHARFTDYAKATHWVAFMHGESMETPR